MGANKPKIKEEDLSKVKSFRLTSREINNFDFISKHYKMNSGDTFKLLNELGLNKIENDRNLKDLQRSNQQQETKIQELEKLLTLSTRKIMEIEKQVEILREENKQILLSISGISGEFKQLIKALNENPKSKSLFGNIF